MYGEGNGTPLQYSCLENPMDGGAYKATHYMGLLRVRHDWVDFTFTFHFHASEKEMATHSSVLAWRIPGTGETGGLSSMGLHRVGHDWSDLAVECNPLKDRFHFIHLCISSILAQCLAQTNYKKNAIWRQKWINFLLGTSIWVPHVA